jgi:PilZ domain
MKIERQSPRLRTLKGGSIIFGLAAGINCVIRNMSKTGACLEVESPVGVPDAFTLLIKPEILKRACHVAWRSAKRIGVRFA